MEAPDPSAQHSASQSPSRGRPPAPPPGLFGAQADEPLPTPPAGASGASPAPKKRSFGGGSIAPLPPEALDGLSPAERLAALTAAKSNQKRAGRKPVPRHAPTPPAAEDAEVVFQARKEARALAPHDARRAIAEEALLDAGLTPKKAGSGQGSPYMPSAEERARVQMLAAFGFPAGEIALLVINPATNRPVDRDTLLQHFSHELASGPVMATSNVARKLYERATKDKGDVEAQKFWLKARGGNAWREKATLEVEVRAGVLVAPSEVTPEQWIAAQAASNAARGEPA